MGLSLTALGHRNEYPFGTYDEAANHGAHCIRRVQYATLQLRRLRAETPRDRSPSRR